MTLKERAAHLPSLALDAGMLARFELFVDGAWTPGPLFPIAMAAEAAGGTEFVLRDPNSMPVAIFVAREWRDGVAHGSLELAAPAPRAGFREPRRRPAGGAAAGMLSRRFPSLPAVRALAAAGSALVLIADTGDGTHHARARAWRAAAPAGTALALIPWSEGLPEAEVVVNHGAAAALAEPDSTEYPPGALAIIEEAVPPRHKQGFCVWFTGLPSSGKSTIADQLAILLEERGRRVTLLDGDVVRTHLSKGLGFSREDRDTNIRRIGYVASEIVRHHGIAIAAAVSPYEAARLDARRMVGADRFAMVWVDTPQQVCEERDVKGFYAKARAGGLSGFTGVDDPYEIPAAPEVTLRTDGTSAGENARAVIAYLERAGLLMLESAVA